MKILVTNDDSIHAKGIRTLIKIAREFGEVTVVAPDSPRSGTGHGITIATPLRLKKLHEEDNYREYMSNGLPVDCVKLGQKLLFDGSQPDLVLSGINHGSNASTNVIYSGTMAAVIEACIEGMPAIGFSLLDHAPDADFSQAEDFIRDIIKTMIENPLPKGTCLNVNIPKIKKEEILGVRVCKQANAFWNEIYVERRDPFGIEYFWLDGEFVGEDADPESDMWALNNHYISVVPVHFDLTDYKQLNPIKHLLGK